LGFGVWGFGCRMRVSWFAPVLEVLALALDELAIARLVVGPVRVHENCTIARLDIDDFDYPTLYVIYLSDSSLGPYEYMKTAPLLD